jgi:hypothetical protein
VTLARSGHSTMTMNGIVITIRRPIHASVTMIHGTATNCPGTDPTQVH